LRLYEGMFLIDNTHANAEWDTVVNKIHEILLKNEAEIVKTEKWGEKKLAYKIKGHKRGTYLLVHFNAKNTSIANIERDLQLSDFIIRSLILRDTVIEDLSAVAADEEGNEKQNEETQPIPEKGSIPEPESESIEEKQVEVVEGV